MGSGTFTTSSFTSYSNSRGRGVSSTGFVTNDSLADYYTQSYIHKDMIPYHVTRECVDSEEHPNTIPVILALDLTGSMGGACVKTAQSLNKIMTMLYEKFTDIEFLIMGVGDLECDRAPVQVSQFESDVRIAEHLDKVYMEHGGGGNGFESYTAAWYFGLHHTKLDCWKRGKKGIIITMGDEPLNPYLPKYPLEKVTGDNLEADVETKDLYELTKEKFDIYHIAIDDFDDCYQAYKSRVDKTFKDVLKENYKVSTLDELPSTIVKCIENSVNGYSTESFTKNGDNNSNLISW
jgi:hypothetical protein